MYFQRVELAKSVLVPEGFPLQEGFNALAQLYKELDLALAKSTAALNLPCKAGCDACCHQSVFLTPLEFLAAWDWLQSELEISELHEVVTDALSIYRVQQSVIDRLDLPPEHDADDHFTIVETLRFRCPLLSSTRQCRVHPARELYARLFGGAWERRPGALYACHIVSEHLEGKELSLLVTRDWAQKLNQLPLTHRRTVYPAYIAELYGVKPVPIYRGVEALNVSSSISSD